MVKLLSLIAALLDITDSFNMLSPCPTDGHHSSTRTVGVRGARNSSVTL